MKSSRWSEDALLSRRRDLGARAGRLPAQATSRSMLNVKSRRGQCEVTAREQRADRHVTARDQHVQESSGAEGKVSSACCQQQSAVVTGTCSALFLSSGLTRREKWLVLLPSAFFSPALSSLSFTGEESMGSTNMTKMAPEDADKHVRMHRRQTCAHVCRQTCAHGMCSCNADKHVLM